jgi:hypothetical protein
LIDAADGAETAPAPEAWLEFRDFDGTLRRFEASDIFEALVAVRRSFEERGCRLLCAGARPDVWPSGMGRSMARGRKAYVTRLGSPAKLEALVDIFDPATTELVGTVEEQRAFHEKWFEPFLKGRR